MALLATACSDEDAAPPRVSAADGGGSVQAGPEQEKTVWEFETVAALEGAIAVPVASGAVDTVGDELHLIDATLPDGRKVAGRLVSGRVLRVGVSGGSPGAAIPLGEKPPLPPAVTDSLVEGVQQPIRRQEDISGEVFDVDSYAVGGLAAQGRAALVTLDLWRHRGATTVDRADVVITAEADGVRAVLTTQFRRAATRELHPAALEHASAPVQLFDAGSHPPPIEGCGIEEVRGRWALRCPGGEGLTTDAVAIGGVAREGDREIELVALRQPAMTLRGPGSEVPDTPACMLLGAASDVFQGLGEAMEVVEPVLLGLEGILAFAGAVVDAAAVAILAEVLALAVVVAAVLVAMALVGCLLDAYVQGEPHLMTVDGRRYDFQAVGEFVAYESPSLAVQHRYEPIRSGKVSTTTAAAVRFGAHSVVVLGDDRSDGKLRVTLDGEPAMVGTEGIWFDDGGYVGLERWSHPSLVAIAPDGSYARMVLLGDRLNTSMSVRRGDGSGLLGRPDGDPSNDLTTRDGMVLSPSEVDSRAHLYERFGHSWRVTEAERLFVDDTWGEYRTAEVLAFPSELTSLEDFSESERDDAVHTCREAGVGAGAIDDCAFDLLVTGDATWVRDAAAMSLVDGSSPSQLVVDPGREDEGPEPTDGPDEPDAPVGSEPDERPVTRIELGTRVEGTHQGDSDGLELFEFDAGPGDVVVEFFTCAPHSYFWRLIDPDGNTVGLRDRRGTGQEGCGPSKTPLLIGPYTLTAAGRHRLLFEGDDGETYAFEVRPA